MSTSVDLREAQYAKLCDSIDRGEITYTKHAKQRMSERSATESMINRVLLRGKHETIEDRWNDKDKQWSFSFRDVVDNKDVRVCTTLNKSSVIIITVVDLTNSDITCLRSTAPSFKEEESSMSFDDLLQKKMEKLKSPGSSSAKENKKHVSLPKEKAYKQDELGSSSYDHVRKKSDKQALFHPYMSLSSKKR